MCEGHQPVPFLVLLPHPQPSAHIEAVASQSGPLRMSFQQLRLRADEDCSRRGHSTFYNTNWVLLQLQWVD